MKEALCRAFCEALTIRKVPAGIAVGTPFRRGQDALTFFIVRMRGDPLGRVRLEDDGLTIPDLEASGVNLSDGARAIAFGEMLAEHGVLYDEGEGVLHSDPMPEERVADVALSFVALLLRVQDFTLLNRERVEEAFKDDVLKAVTEHFNGRATILTNVAPAPSLSDYPADILIRAPELAPLAVFVGTNETRALEALLLRKEMTLARIAGNVMLVVQQEKPKKVKKRTMGRAYYSIPVRVFPGYVGLTMNEMEGLVFGTTSTPPAMLMQ